METNKKKKFTITNRFTNKIIIEGEAESLKSFLEQKSGADLCGANLRNADLCNADLRNADLCGADLCGADLRDANLRGADLCGANLRGVKIKISQQKDLIQTLGIELT